MLCLLLFKMPGRVRLCLVMLCYRKYIFIYDKQGIEPCAECT